MKRLPLAAGPFAHKGNSVQRTMGLVLIALAPATAWGLYLYGWPAIYLFLVTVAACIAAEALCLRLAKKPIMPFISDGSAILTGWLLAMTLPPWAPWWVGVVGAVMAIVVGKHVFGGIGQNLFNPAMVARVALLISFPLEMTRFIAPIPMGSNKAPDMESALSITFGGGADWDTVSSASILGHAKTEIDRGVDAVALLGDIFDPFALSVGSTVGSLGETSALLILAGGLFLIFTRVISWTIPLSLFAGLLIPAALLHLIAPGQYPGADLHLLAGATMLGAFFIATDLVTSPVSRTGQIIFGAGIGFLCYVIRTWGGYPEGMAFAVLLLNACTPLIDRYIQPRIYGRTRKGQPIEYKDKAEAK